MNVNKFNQLASDLGYNQTEAQHLKNVYTTSHSGFPVSLSLGMPALANVANGLPVLTIYLADDATTEKATNEYSPKNIGKLLNQELKQDKIKVYPMKNQLHFVLKISKKDEPHSYMNHLYSVIDSVFNEQGIRANYTCPACGQGNCDSMYFNESNSLTPAHGSCKSSLIEQTTQNYAEKEKNSKFLLGLVGLIGGGIVGALPSILLMVFMETEFLYLFALIPLGSFYGYKLLGGEPGIVPTILVIVWTLFMVYASYIAALYFMNDQWYSIQYFVKRIYYGGFSLFLELMWFGYLSAFLGLIPTVMEGMNTANKKAKAFTKSIENMQGYTPSNEIYTEVEEPQPQVQVAEKETTHVDPEIL